MPIQQSSDSLDHVRIPAELNATLSRFFGVIQLRILEQAVQSAASRLTGEQSVIVQKDELALATQEILHQAAAEVNETFAVSELKHVRRAS